MKSAARVFDQFPTWRAQAQAWRFGMWVFLASEVTLFGGLFTLYAAYRVMYRGDFSEGVSHDNLWLGSLNTLILITSSLTAALAVAAARSGHFKSVQAFLLATLLLGAIFLGVKGLEWRQHFHEGILPGTHYHFEKLSNFGAEIFFTLYFLMTGLHALHVIAGMCVLAFLFFRARRAFYSADHHLGIELGTLYWHLVDIVWIFLWPLFYLTR